MNPLARWSSLTLPRRLRLIGAAVLVAGLAGAWIFFRIETGSHVATLDELLPGDSKRRARQTEILMGSLVVTLLGWLDALKDPTNEAIIIASASVLLALGLFRIASMLDAPAPASAPAAPAMPAPRVKPRPRFIVHRGMSERNPLDDAPRQGDAEGRRRP